MKYPDEVNSWEFIKAHLYDREKARKMSKTEIRELIRVYRENRETRPVTGEKLLLVFRKALEKQFGMDDGFGDGCAVFLIGMIAHPEVEYTGKSAFLEQVCNIK